MEPLVERGLHNPVGSCRLRQLDVPGRAGNAYRAASSLPSFRNSARNCARREHRDVMAPRCDPAVTLLARELENQLRRGDGNDRVRS